MVWQPIFFTKRLVNVDNGVIVNTHLGDVRAGVITDASNNTIQRFDQDVILERFRGNFFHDASGEAQNPPEFPVPVLIGAQILPRELETHATDDDMPNLFQSGDGDDYPIYMMCHCDASGGFQPLSDDIDSKAKRKLPVGDFLRFSVSFFVNPSLGTNVDLSLSLLGRTLWQLKI